MTAKKTIQGFAAEVVAITSLRPHPRNYKSHPDDQLDHIVQSIKENGVYRNIVVARDGTILAGHGVVLAAERMWPGVVETKRRYDRPQHVVKDSWKKFDTPLKLKPGIDLEALKAQTPELELVQVKAIESPTVQGFMREREK